ncbi:hypothetical protein FOZ63_010336 [Perkinsus olseni]|nr:hypothetical protein FOZ63_010336 [Perkinsus olseni]
MTTQNDFNVFLENVEGATDDDLRNGIVDRLHDLERLRQESSTHYYAVRRRLVQLAANSLKDDFNPLLRASNVDVNNFRQRLWAPSADISRLTRECDVRLPNVDYNIDLSTFAPTSNVARSETTRVETPNVSVSGLPTLNVIPRLDLTMLNDFEIGLCRLKLTTPLLVDVKTWHLLDPRLRRFVRDGTTYFPPDVGTTITTQVLNDHHLLEDVTIDTLGGLLRWSIVEGFLDTLGCWDVNTTDYVLGVPKLPHDGILNVKRCGRLSMSLHYSFLRLFATYKGLFLSATTSAALASRDNVLAHNIYHNVGKSMSHVFSKYENVLQYFDIDVIEDELRLDVLRLAEQDHYYRDEVSVMEEDDPQ